MELNILVVDDSPIMRKMIIKTIHLCGLDIVEIYEAGDGKEALEKLKQHPVDLLLVDVNMPVMDGIEMLERVRHDPERKTMPVFIISTESNPKRIEFIKSQGADFLHKPFTPEDLREKIMQIVEMQ